MCQREHLRANHILVHVIHHTFCHFPPLIPHTALECLIRCVVAHVVEELARFLFAIRDHTEKHLIHGILLYIVEHFHHFRVLAIFVQPMENLPAGVFVKIIEQRLDHVVVQLHGIRLHLLLDHLLHPLVRQDRRGLGDVLRGEHCFGVVRERCLYRRSFFPEYFVHGDTKDLGNLRQLGNIGHRPTVFPAADRLIADPQRVRQRHLRHALRPPALGDSLSDLFHCKHGFLPPPVPIPLSSALGRSLKSVSMRLWE